MDKFGVPDTTAGRFVDQFSGKYYYYLHAEPFAESTGLYGYNQPSVQCCPVCKGKGTVRSGFYDDIDYSFAIALLPRETCRSCEGKGYIVIK